MNLKEIVQIGDRDLIVKLGKLAPQADGTCTIQIGETVVMTTAVASDKYQENLGFLPLTVGVEEKYYAAGKISGSRFFKREGKPSTQAVLTSRLTDRCLRPLFNKNVRNSIQIICTILSTDFTNTPDTLCINSASIALSISDIPFKNPIAAVKVGLRDGNFIINPSPQEVEEGGLELLVAGSKEKVVMLEAGSNEIPEEIIAKAIKFGHENLQPIIHLQENLTEKYGKTKRTFPLPQINEELKKDFISRYSGKIKNNLFASVSKQEKEKTQQKLKYQIIENYEKERPEEDNLATEIEEIFNKNSRSLLRKSIIEEEKRIDQRGLEEIREINCEVNLLPRTHGSALFNRGETQVLNIATLGPPSDRLLIENIEDTDLIKQRYIHHYNALPYSLGLTGFLRAASRREIGHGKLAEKALLPVLPPDEDFFYTLRLVSEALSQNGSSSMASTCASTLSLMDAGVPIKAPVAGISIGLIDENGQQILLTDIQGLEDAWGDMDFKVAGTRKGITAIQLDVKNDGLTNSLISEILTRARKARLAILDKMETVIAQPRPSISPFAPQIIRIVIPEDKVGLVIGSGGKTIKKIQEATDAEITIEDEGEIFISADSEEKIQKAKEQIMLITGEKEIAVGTVCTGKVVKITNFGAFVEISPGKDGLLHISEIAPYHVKNVQDELTEGEEIKVKVIRKEPNGRIALSKKQIES